MAGIDRYYESMNVVNALLAESKKLYLPEFTVEVLKQHPIEIATALNEMITIEDDRLLQACYSPVLTPEIYLGVISIGEIFKDLKKSQEFLQAHETGDVDKVFRMAVRAIDNEKEVMARYLCNALTGFFGDFMGTEYRPLIDQGPEAVKTLAEAYSSEFLHIRYAEVMSIADTWPIDEESWLKLTGIKHVADVLDVLKLKNAQNQKYAAHIARENKAKEEQEREKPQELLTKAFSPFIDLFMDKGTFVLGEEEAADLATHIGKCLNKAYTGEYDKE